jgi:hypothetical protein
MQKHPVIEKPVILHEGNVNDEVSDHNHALKEFEFCHQFRASGVEEVHMPVDGHNGLYDAMVQAGHSVSYDMSIVLIAVLHVDDRNRRVSAKDTEDEGPGYNAYNEVPEGSSC